MRVSCEIHARFIQCRHVVSAFPMNNVSTADNAAIAAVTAAVTATATVSEGFGGCGGGDVCVLLHACVPRRCAPAYAALSSGGGARGG